MGKPPASLAHLEPGQPLYQSVFTVCHCNIVHWPNCLFSETLCFSCWWRTLHTSITLKLYMSSKLGWSSN